MAPMTSCSRASFEATARHLANHALVLPRNPPNVFDGAHIDDKGGKAETVALPRERCLGSCSRLA